MHREALELGLDCAVEVRDEEEVEKALDRVDPEIFILSPVEAERDETPLEVVLDLLAAVPAGKLAIADLRRTTPDEVQALERAGCDAVIVSARDVSPLVGGPPPRGLASRQNRGTLFSMRALLVAGVVALALVLLAPASAAKKGGCPAPWRRRLAEAREQGRCARLLPGVDAEPARRARSAGIPGHLLGRQGQELPRQLPREHGDLGSGDVHVNFRGYPGRRRSRPAPGARRHGKVPCFTPSRSAT